MTGALAAACQSGSPRARVIPESWGESNLYCPNSDKSRAGCSSPKLSQLRNNTTRLHLVSVGRRPAIIPARASAFAARQHVASQRSEDGSAAPARRRLFAPVENSCFVIARRARLLAFAVRRVSRLLRPRRQAHRRT